MADEASNNGENQRPPANPPAVVPLSPLGAAETKKEDLFNRLKDASIRHRDARNKAYTLRGALEQKIQETGINARELRRAKERLEFRIATEATSLAKEREMMKEMRIIEKQLQQASEVEKLENEMRAAERDARGIDAEIMQIKRDIDEAKTEVKALRDDEKEKRALERDTQWQERKRGQLMEHETAIKKELEPFMGGLDPEGVDLGSIAVIKKKGSA